MSRMRSTVDDGTVRGVGGGVGVDQNEANTMGID
jgi:hypothetical protein